jgi:serine/threonine protein kinase
VNTERWKKIDKLFDAVLDLPESQREKYLSTECEGDDELRNEVLELVRAAKTASFLERSAIGVAARKLADDKAFFTEREFENRTIGSYKIVKQIGSGGMGEVYLATDSKFFRKVALKILPREYASDDERLQRFELEAHAISCINHPNIVTIFDVGSVDGVNYLATEYVEGKSLRQAAGELRLSEILDVGIQVCEALSAAHRAGIIHRDIKPENIVLRPDGYVKVLDFGLAKLNRPSIASPADLARTGEGVIIGTPAYMSPEQIGNETVDYRTDLWSLGVILFELLTGSNPFKSADRRNTFEAILRSDPLSARSKNADVSADLQRVLERALEKNRTLRYQTASDLGADLKRIKREYDAPRSRNKTAEELKPSPAGSGKYIAAAIALLLLISIGATTWFLLGRSDDSTDSVEWSKARSLQLTDQAGTEYFPALAPDGKSFVYAGDQTGNFDILSKRIGGTTSTNLTPDSAADDTQPSFSADGELIAFRSEREPRGIYVMEATGENPRRVSDFGFHPSFSPDGKEIVVSIFGDDQPTVRRSGTRGIWIVNLETSERREVSKLYGSFPAWSPDGKHIAFWFYPSVGGRRDIAVVPATGGEEVVLTKDFALSNWNPVWSPDGKFLYFISDRNGSVNFWRIRMDAGSGKPLSEPEPVVAPSTYSRHLNFSSDGTRMIYVQSNNQANIEGIQFDPNAGRTVGNPFWITSGDREVTRAELSPDGRDFLMRQIRRTQDDIVIFNREENSWHDITRDVAFDRYPRWSPDGKQIAFVSDRTGNYEIWTSAPDGSKMKQITFVGPTDTGTSFPTWSPDGKRMIYSVNSQSYIIDLSKNWGDQIPVPIPKHPDGYSFNVWDWSPDGNKVAGTFSAGMRAVGVYSFETNSFQIVAENPLPAPLAIPSWHPDSRHILFTNGNKIVLANIDTKKTRELFAPRMGEVRSPFISRDGRLLYYSMHISESDVWLLDASNSE